MNMMCVCVAMEVVVDRSSIVGAQKIGNIWRLYVNTEEQKHLLLQQGINLNNQHIEVFLTNPATTSQINRLVKPIKITIKDVPMNYSNEAVLKMLENNNGKLTSNVKFSLMRDNDGNYTDYTNGDRYVYMYVYANTKHIQNNPLPRFMLIGAFVARVFHKGQIYQRIILVENV